MGITVNGVSGTGVSVELAKLVDKFNRLPATLYNMGVTIARETAYAYAEGCAENTPVDTGNMLTNWNIDPEGNNDAYDDRLLTENRGPSAMERYARVAQYLPEVEAKLRRQSAMIQSKDGARNISTITIYNRAPYANKICKKEFILEQGRAAAAAVIAVWKTKKKSLYIKASIVHFNDTHKLKS